MPIGYSTFQANTEPAKGFKVLVPRPTDAYLGPWEDPIGTTTAGVNLVNGLIGPGLRYIGQKVIIVANSTPGVPGGVTQAYVYWYRGGTGNGDLVEFASGAAVSGSDFPTGISAAGGTFSRLLVAQQGISTSFLYVSGGATFATQQITALSGISTASLYSSGLGSFVGGLTTTGIYASTGSTFAGTAYFTSGVTTNTLDVTGRSEFVGGATFDTTAVFGITGGVTFAASNVPAGTSLGTGFALIALGNAALNGNVLIGPSGGIVTGGPTAASVIVRSGTTFEREVNFVTTVTGPTFAGFATSAVNALSLGGFAAANYARTGVANTFSLLQTFSSGVLVSGGGLSGANAQFSGLVNLTGTNGISASGGATFAQVVNAPTFKGNLTGNVTGNADTATNANNAWNLAGISGASYAKLSTSNTFGADNTFNGGLSGANAQFSGLVHLTGTNGLSAAGGATFAQVVNAPTFKGNLTGNVTGNADTATTATNANNAWNLAGISGASYAKLSTSNTFGADNTFNENVTIGKTLTVQGNFYVTGTLTTVNRSELSVDDISILLAGATATTMTDSLANDGGIKLQGGTVKSILWKNTLGGQWESSENFNLATGKAYRIAGTTLLASNFLTNAVVGSSLASVGTLTNGVWNASIIGLQYGGVGGNISSVQDNAVLYKTGTGVTATSLAGTSSQVLSANGSGVPTWVNLTGLTVGNASSVSITDQPDSASTFFMVFVGGTSGSRTLLAEAGITYQPSTNTLSCARIEATIDGGVWT